MEPGTVHVGGCPSDPGVAIDLTGRQYYSYDVATPCNAQGSSHEEIAESLGLRRSSIKILLFRARRRLAAALGARS